MSTAADEADVKTSFKYWASERTPDISEALLLVDGTHPELKEADATVHSIRKNLAAYSLTDYGFQVVDHTSSFLASQAAENERFLDKTFLNKEYSPELCTLIKKEFGPLSVVAFNTVVRDLAERPPMHLHRADYKAPKTTSPLFSPHNDYSPSGARTILRSMLSTFFEDTDQIDSTTPEERKEFFDLRSEIICAEEKAMHEAGVSNYLSWDGSNYHGRRWAILSIWRPLEVVQRDPLAILDPRSLFTPKNKDPCAEAKLPHPNRAGFVSYYEITNMLPRYPGEGIDYQWLYLPNQKPTEVFAIKIFDSSSRGSTNHSVAHCAPHSAFRIANTDHLPPRRSIDVRMILLW